MMAPTAMLEATRRGRVRVLRMSHGKASALDVEFVRVLTHAFAEVESADDSALVLTGSGSIFSAGVDLLRVIEGGGAYAHEFIPALSECLLRLFTLPVPAVAAMNGHAIAGGCVLACACDRRVMARGKGRVGLPELRVGVPFPWLPLEITRFAVPAPFAQDAVLTGDTYAPEEALRRGLVDELAEGPEVLDRAVAIAESFASIPAASFRTTKMRLRARVVEEWYLNGAASDAHTLDLWSSDEVLRSVREYVRKTLGK
jgi:enoyl-CoA hydratase/carnithine racemase